MILDAKDREAMDQVLAEVLGFRYHHEPGVMVKNVGPFELILSGMDDPELEKTAFSIECECRSDPQPRSRVHYGVSDNPSFGAVSTLIKILEGDLS